MTSPDSQFRVVASAAAFVLCMHAITSTLVARTIDDFSVGPIEVSRTGETLATALQTGLDPNHVLGGGREIEVGQFGGAVQTLLIDTAASELRFSTDSMDTFGLAMARSRSR